jgi:4-oxalocrotonate tautomerase
MPPYAIRAGTINTINIRSRTMPHVIVKLSPGKSEQQKARLALEITDSVMSVLNYGAESVSVAFEEVDSCEWAEKVYRPDIKARWNQLYKKPEYNPLEIC